MSAWDNTEETKNRLVFAVEMAHGSTTFYGDMETLGRLMVIYEECGYFCSPGIYEDEDGEELNFGMSSFTVKEPAREFTSLNNMLAMPNGVPIEFWSWGLITDFETPDWEHVHMEADRGSGAFLALVDGETDELTLFGQPRLLKTAVDLSRRHRVQLQNMSRKNDEYVSLTLPYSEALPIVQGLTDLGFDPFWREMPAWVDSDDDITLEW